jgi:hypothetical protein
MVISEGKVNQITAARLGVFVVTAAMILGGSPFLAKSYLRSTVPPVWIPEGVEARAATTTQYLETERDIAFRKAIAFAGHLDSSTSNGHLTQRSGYREAVINLNRLDLRLADSLRATITETKWPLAQVIQREHARRLTQRRAQSLNRMVMACFTIAMLVFMYFVRRSQTVPRWAKEISCIAAGAVLAGWFPL